MSQLSLIPRKLLVRIVEWLTQLAKHVAHVDVLQMDLYGKNKAFAKRLSR